MLRSALLYLSGQPALRRWTENSSLADRVTKRFVAGQTLEDELATCQRLNRDNILASVDFLGENVHSVEEARQSRDTYLRIQQEIRARAIRATVSIKLTQFGLDFSKEACLANVEPLVAQAQAMGSRVEIDMEHSGYVDRTLEVVTTLHQRCSSVRAVIQAYLFRSEKDVEMLNVQGIPIRLCKGAYKEPPDLAFPKKTDVDAAYVRLMQQMLSSGVDPAIASHDEKIIRSAQRYVREKNIAPDRFEFQMLYGIRRDLQKELVESGYRLRLYVPYGNAWYPYFMRRLAERPANVLFLARNLIRS
ncbi:MAG TPA: proline dehydrogenase family protein [Bryobacteraceae bacterium]|nr:proline dehydrogenase family protein [Bryobacteraceae bacterium]